jgi:hypothetical protein
MENTLRKTNTETLSQVMKDGLHNMLIDIITNEHKRESTIIDSDDTLSPHERIRAHRESTFICIGTICSIAILTSFVLK